MQNLKSGGRWAMPFLAVVVAVTGATFAGASDLYDPKPTAKGPIGVLDRSRRDYDAIGYRSGNLLFLPTLLTSATFDDNIFATRNNTVSDLVFHIVPTLNVTGDFGTTKLAAYVTADGKISTQRSNLNAVSPGVGLGVQSEIQRDLVFQARADYIYRVEDPADTNRQVGAGVIRELVRYHDFTANASLNKSFNQFFVSVGGAYQHLKYDDVRDTLGNVIPGSRRDEDLATWTLRAGYQASADLKVFVEPSYNIRRYATSTAFDSDGWRLVGGLSSQLGRLITGEVYAGYMQQNYKANIGSVSGFTAGANLRWYPTDLLTLSLQADRTIQDGSVTLGPLQGSPAIVATVAARADYEVWRNLILSARLSYQNYAYQRNITRRDNTYTAGLTASYLFNRFLSGSLDYRYVTNESNTLNGSYNRNQFTVSLKSQF